MSLADVIRLARRNIALVLLPSLVVAAVVWVGSNYALPNWYTATATLIATAEADGTSLTASELRAASLMADDFAAMAEDPQTQLKVAHSLGMPDLDGYVVRVQIVDNTRIIMVSVTGVDPDVVADIANALTETFNRQAEMLLGRGGVSVVSAALPPEHTSGPPRKIYCAVAFAATFALVLVWLVAWVMAEGEAESGREVEELLGKPVVGRVPTCR